MPCNRSALPSLASARLPTVFLIANCSSPTLPHCLHSSLSLVGRLAKIIPNRLTKVLKKKVDALQKQLKQPQNVPPPMSAEAQAPDEQYDDDHEAEDDAEGAEATRTGGAAFEGGRRDEDAGQGGGDNVEDHGGGAEVVEIGGRVEESMEEEVEDDWEDPVDDAAGVETEPGRPRVQLLGDDSGEEMFDSSVDDG